MAADYFQDIPENPPRRPRAGGNPGMGGRTDGIPLQDDPNAGERSIRNINMPDRVRTSRRPPGGRPSSSGGAASGGAPARRGGMKIALWIVILVLVIALGGALAYFALQKSSVTVTPRQHTVVFDGQSSFSAAPDTAELSEADLSYTVTTQTFEESVTVEATGSESVRDFATGKLTIFNEATEDNLRLIKNTRFETPEGLVYRIRNSVVVPGKDSSGPGSLEVTVFADEPGERYNIGAVSRFTLPGLKTSAPEMFNSVYARSNAPMSGGFVGTRPKVSDDDLEDAQTDLQEKLQNRVDATLSSGEGFGEVYVLPGVSTVVFTSESPEFADSGTVRITEKATISVPAFEQGVFARSLAAISSADANEGNISITDPASVSLSVLNEDKEELELGADTINFTIGGNVTFAWSVDLEALAAALAGRDEAAFEAIVSEYPGVESAEAMVQPFWSSSFPQDASTIEITLLEPKGSE